MSALPAALAVSVVDGGLVLEEDPAVPGGSTTQDPMREDLETTDVSPGLEGFLAIFAVVVVTIFLLLSMTKKLRRVAHRTGTETLVDGQFDDRGPSTVGTAGPAGLSGTDGPPSADGAPGADGTADPTDGSTRGA